MRDYVAVSLKNTLEFANNSPVEDLATGQIRVQVDVGHQLEVFIPVVWLGADSVQLLQSNITQPASWKR